MSEYRYDTEISQNFKRRIGFHLTTTDRSVIHPSHFA